MNWLLGNWQLAVASIVGVSTITLYVIVKFQAARLKNQNKLIDTLNEELSQAKKAFEIAKDAKKQIDRINENYEKVVEENKKVVINAKNKKNLDILTNRLNDLLSSKSGKSSSDRHM